MTFRLFSLAIVACLLLPGLASVRAHAADGAAPSVQGAAGPPAVSAPAPPTPPVVVACDKPSAPRLNERTPVSVTLNAATAWQPRGGQVLIALDGDPAYFTGLTVKACFGWNKTQAADYFVSDSLKDVRWTEGFVSVRPSEQTRVMNIGIVVPALSWAPTNVFERWFSAARSAGLGMVPVVDMRLIGYTKDGVLFDEVRPVGITNVPLALLVAASALVLAIVILHRLADDTAPARSRTKRERLRHWLHALFSPDWVLTLVRTPDGRASLSAFQILLWTLVVAVSAMYVMVLSGNLINLTPGTLTLLGIAGAAGLLAAFNDSPGTSGKAGAHAGGAGGGAAGAGSAGGGAGAGGAGAGGAGAGGAGATVSGAGGATISGAGGGATLSGAASGSRSVAGAAAGAPANAGSQTVGSVPATVAGGAPGGTIAGGTAAATVAGGTAAATVAGGTAGATASGAAAGSTASGGSAVGTAGVGSPPTTAQIEPRWRDLIVDPVTGVPDISRTQMLLFTVVSAAFVVMQVLNYYIVPDIPAGYQILIGISNGVYVGRKLTGNSPDQTS